MQAAVRSPLSGLRPRLVLLAVVPAVLAVLLVSAAAIWVGRDLKAERAEAVLGAGADRAAANIGGSADRLQAMVTGVALQEEVRTALAGGDAAALRGLGVPLFQALRAVDPTVAVLEFTDARGRVLLRGHNPGQAGDDKSAVPDVARALRGEAAKGITFSPASGQFAIGATLPVRREGRVVGTVKLGSRLDEATARELAETGGGPVMLFGGTRLVAASVPNMDAATLPAGLADATRPFEMTLPGGVPALGAMRPLHDIEGRRVGMLVLAYDMTAWEAAETHALVLKLVAALVLLAGAGAAGMLAANRVARPLGRMEQAMGAIAGGALDTPIPGLDRRDEIGAMAKALEVFRDGAAAKARMEAEAAAAQAERDRRARAIDQHTQEFGAALAGVMKSLGEASGRMAQTATQMAAIAAQTESRSAETARDAEASVADLGSVAAATEELTASVGEIARQASTAATAARGVADRAEQADATMQRLADAAGTISEVARLIGQIAAQTNLLALNATIEAARAGEAGKGFAVVAGEVKSLAAQTAKATEEIASQIQSIQGVATEAVGVVRGMAGQVRDMGETSAAIAAAVEQQGAATREIAANVTRVLDSSRRAVDAMGEAREAARASLQASREVQTGATDVSSETDGLRREVDHFISALREVRGDRRRYDRMTADGRIVQVAMRGTTNLTARLRDISRGGLGFELDGEKPAGLEVGREIRVTLPAAGAVPARVARVDWPMVAAVVRLDDETGARMEAAMADLPRNREAA
ncbi:methyl-accepting chemotaxis protein [Falsiroseomonas oryzae]|uniref:methyl-accepting chemotaxis protein n=1 Tax=Falsiroseomonas oryzae TaxID=2766473 RepID=UPI0022EB8159|nr:methyl-accepting chemotaxis protein [Roseomonas sp. MO-31]